MNNESLQLTYEIEAFGLNTNEYGIDNSRLLDPELGIAFARFARNLRDLKSEIVDKQTPLEIFHNQAIRLNGPRMIEAVRKAYEEWGNTGGGLEDKKQILRDKYELFCNHGNKKVATLQISEPEVIINFHGESEDEFKKHVGAVIKAINNQL